ncbi:flavonol reductase/cinnamoyl-CoA reductase family protein [Schizosaccharomyces cryophilus OY26]|uniref:Flavonol reductase/cinnamoyl-CoA reductase family protein n=1 Tax=Schizosaccharomyces cryophilus (strain OY26 / ATCC MYA-4695 / CBS 11777 / NBRC 106824 / NRRL Y48691) TaxID=653667 RepID=S9VUJ6_SCHCR|nr:flavonol reductase/cinnamoyl-CoA reductase family protein [Schizosaccharomyces cryophilus OY26]EPY49824.1 flavonol reductase/cinnamoyl-CoA reductase family protein [Schizosaccharomyces cryophilus OY26]
MPNQSLVLVTGVTGFIGSHVAVTLVNNGYRVRGAVRSMEKAEELVGLNPELKDKVEFVFVKDIVAPNAFKDAVQGCDYICHVASPFFYENVTDNKTQLLDPAHKGTINILEASLNEPKVKRVVITSSFVAIGDFMKDPYSGSTYTEKDWNPISYEEALETKNGFAAYCASKKFAEIAARNFVKERQPHYDMCTVNPSLVIGPPIHPMKTMESLNASNRLLWSLINGSKAQPSFQHVQVDVRDIANAHVVAIEKPEMSNGRMLVSKGPFITNDVCKILREEFPEMKDVISEPTDVPFNDKHYKSDNSYSISLGLQYYSEKQTYIDTALKLWERAKQLALVR